MSARAGRPCRGRGAQWGTLFEKQYFNRAEHCLNSGGNHGVLASVMLGKQADQARVRASASAEHGRICQYADVEDWTTAHPSQRDGVDTLAHPGSVWGCSS